MVKKVSAKERKINVLIGFTQGELAFLDKTVSKKHPGLKSRAAIIRLLLCRAMVHPNLLDLDKPIRC